MGKGLSLDQVNETIKNNFVQNVEALKYTNRRSPITLHCLECNFIWEAQAQSVLYSGNHHCPNCNGPKKIQYTCAYCGKTILRSPSEIKASKSGYHYCSRECGNRHKNQIRLLNGEWDSSLNYRLKAFQAFPHKCAVCGWSEDERILEVHHKDEHRENNTIDNLCILCPTCHRKITLGYYILTDNFQLIAK